MTKNSNNSNSRDNNQSYLYPSSNIEAILNKSLSLCKNDREESENLMEYYLNNQFSSFLSELCLIISDERYSKEIRQMSVFVVKNKILNKNSFHIQKWLHNLDQSTKYQIKTSIMSSLASNNPQVRRAISNLIASIFKTELSQSQEWIEAVDNLFFVASNEKNENILIESSLETMIYIVEEVYEMNKNSVSNVNILDYTLNFLIRNIQFSLNSNNMQRTIFCLNAFNRIIPYAEKIFKNDKEKNILMNILFQITEKILTFYPAIQENLQYHSENKFNSDLILELILKNLIQICTHHFFKIQEFFNELFVTCSKIISNYSLKDELLFNERTVLFALEILCIIGDKEIESYNFIIDNHIINSGFVSNSTKFFQKFSKDLIQLLTKNLIYIKHSCDEANFNVTNQFKNYESNYEDNLLSDWTISKASAYLLSIVARLSDPSSLDKLIIFAENNFHSKDHLLRNSALLVLCCCLETTHKEKISNLLKYNFEDFFKIIADKSSVVSKTCSWLICKITNSYPYVIEKSMFCKYIPLFIRIISYGRDNRFFVEKNDYEDFYEEDEDKFQDSYIYFSKEIRVNLCIVLVNLIKFYGDLNIVKNSNPFSPYCMELLDNLLKTAINESNSLININIDDLNLPFFALQVCAKIIEYSSEDLQDHLENILNKFLDFLEKSNEIIKNDIQRSEFEENICVVIESIYCKIKRKVKYDIGLRSFNAIISSFIKRKDVYSSGIFCITSISKNIKKDFIPLLNKFMEYVYFSLKKFDEPNSCKCAIIAITNIICNFNKEFFPHVEKTIPVLLEILSEENINRSVKLLAISAIGDLCLNIPESISDHIIGFMQILFSASEIAVNITDKNKGEIDEDTLEYVHHLKLSLVETFNSLIFGLTESNQTSYLNIYLPNLLTYLKSFVSIDNNLEIELLKNVICIIADISQLYSIKEIKQFIGEEFIDKAINKMKNQNNKIYNPSINWAESVLKG